jgi:hypothetical protein
VRSKFQKARKIGEVIVKSDSRRRVYKTIRAVKPGRIKSVGKI